MEIETERPSKLGNFITLFIIVVVLPIFSYVTQNNDNDLNYEIPQVCNAKNTQQFLRTSDDVHTNTMQIDDFKKFSRCLNLYATNSIYQRKVRHIFSENCCL